MSSSLDTTWIHRGRVPCLDGIRGIGTLLIVFGHSTVCARSPNPLLDRLYRSVHWAEIAIHLFFVLSGFLITLLLIREWNRDGRISLRGFYQRRILRIMPAYMAYLAALFVLQFIGVLAISRRDWLGSLTYSMNFQMKSGWELGHFWSLAVEEHFYLIWPAILAIFGLNAGRWTLAVCILFSPLVRYWSHTHWSEFMNVDTATFNYMDVIAFGAGLAFLCQSEKFRGLAERLRPICGGLILGVCVGLVGSAWLQNRSDSYQILGHRTVTGFLCAALIYLVTGFSLKWVQRVLEWRPLMWIGVVSYSFYVWQQLFTGRTPLPEWVSTFPMNVVFITVAGVLSHYLIERPFMRIKDRANGKSSARLDGPRTETIAARACAP